MIRLPPSRALVIVVVGVSNLAAGCGGGGRSKADTVSATAASVSSSQAKVSDTTRDSATAAPIVASAPVRRAPAPKPVSGGAATKKKPSEILTPSKPPTGRDTTIIGWDSVIRLPVRTLPAATSTPTR